MYIISNYEGLMCKMPFDSFIHKISGQKEILTLEDFQERLDHLISRIEQKYKESTASEQKYQQKYNEKLSKLDFNGSKNAVEDGRRQLAKSLDLEVQLEFLKNIKILSCKIPEKSFHTSKQRKGFNQIVKQIFDHKIVSSQFGRRIILKQFMKFIPSSDDILSVDTTTEDEAYDEEIEKILKEVAEGTENGNSIDSEVEKILEEIKRKKSSE